MAIRVEELLIHRSWLHGLARGMVHSRDAADDLVQETYLAALRGKAPPERGSVRGWLAGVLRNRARMHVRGEVRRRRREQLCHESDHTFVSPEQVVQRIEAEQRLAQAVLELPEPLRATVLLRYFEGLSAADIARRENIPAGTVRWRLSIALGRLRTDLGEGADPTVVGGVAPTVGASVLGHWASTVQQVASSVSAGAWHSWAIAVLVALVVVFGGMWGATPGDRVSTSAAGMLGGAAGTATQLPGLDEARSLAADVAPAELYLQVSDPGGSPIAEAAAYADQQFLGLTDVDGELTVRSSDKDVLRARSGQLVVEARGYRPYTGAYRPGSAVTVTLFPDADDLAMAPAKDADMVALAGRGTGVGEGSVGDDRSPARVGDDGADSADPTGPLCQAGECRAPTAPTPWPLPPIPVTVVPCTHKLAYSPQLANMIRRQREMHHPLLTTLWHTSALAGFVMINLSGCELIYGDTPEQETICVTDVNADGSTCVTCTDPDGTVATSCDGMGGMTDCTTEVQADGSICMTCTSASGMTTTTCGMPAPEDCTTTVQPDGTMCVTCVDAAGNSTTTCDGSPVAAQCVAEQTATGLYCVVCTDPDGNVETVCEDGMQCTSDVAADGTVCINCAGTAGTPPTTTCSNSSSAGDCTTETQADGTVCETCINADGTATTTCTDPSGDCVSQTQPDGSVCETCTDAAGMTTTTCTNPPGGGDCTTETQADGTVCETCIDVAGNSTTTCTDPNGTTCMTETQADGTVCEICTAADGTTTTTCNP